MENNTVSPQDMIKILPENEYKMALKFIDLGGELNCKPQTRYAHSNKYWRCVFSKKKPSRVLFTVECTNDWWRVKAMLSNLEQYKDELNYCSADLVNQIKTAYDCHRCNTYCKTPNPFSIDGVEYKKCIGCSFYFTNLSEDDQDALIRLIKREFQY